MRQVHHKYDTLTYVKRLEQAGFKRVQAEAQAEVLRDLIEENLATRTDIEKMHVQIEKIHAQIKQSELNTRQEMKQLEYKITIRLGGIMVAGIVVLSALHFI